MIFIELRITFKSQFDVVNCDNGNKVMFLCKNDFSPLIVNHFNKL